MSSHYRPIEKFDRQARRCCPRSPAAGSGIVIDRLLNDPDVPLQPALIWHLLDEVSGQQRRGERLAVGDIPSASLDA